MRILIVDDEDKTRNYLNKGLSEHGFIIDTAPDGEEGLHLAKNIEYDLIVLDVMMPKRDGWDVLKILRDMEKQIPVLFLTAKDAVADRVKGLELGADDYLVKPFAFSELLARVKTLLRRGQTRQEDVLLIDDLKMDLLKHKAWRAGKRLDLTPKEFALLSLFIRRKGDALSRTLIAEQVWDINFDTDTNVIDVAVRRLRQKVDDDFSKKLIHTVRGIGYVLEKR
jgi:two-component system, OmpR family, copper resistance phosphate regulon response regulator CusR